MKLTDEHSTSEPAPTSVSSPTQSPKPGRLLVIATIIAAFLVVIVILSMSITYI